MEFQMNHFFLRCLLLGAVMFQLPAWSQEALVKEQAPLRGLASLTFEHFGQPMQLTQGKGGVYVNRQGIEFSLLPSLIAKVSREITPEEIKHWSEKIANVTLLATLTSNRLYLLDITNTPHSELIAELQNMPRVHYVQPNLMQRQEEGRFSSEADNTLLSRVSPKGEVAMRQCAGESCAPVKVAIIDQGFNFSHPEFEAMKLEFSFDVDNRQTHLRVSNRQNGHGTLVAGVIAAKVDGVGVDGLAPQAEIVAIQQTSTMTSDMVLAFHLASMMQVDIVNCSWSIPFLPEPLFDVIQHLLSEASSVKHIVVAAGNHSKVACADNALTQIDGLTVVGGGRNGTPHKRSNYGVCVDLYAPSGYLTVANDGVSYRRFSGTSSSAAYVTGVIARRMLLDLPVTKETIRELFNTQRE
jgi:subtilisin